MFPDQANYSRKRQRNTSLLGSSCTRAIVLVDVSQLASPKGANNLDTAKLIDALRLSVLRILVQLSLSCTRDSSVEWATRFFDSRRDGVGKTPAELKARLRSRKAAQGTRGFTRLTKTSFQAFGDACLAVACGLQGDPLARDHETALKRWCHGRKKELQRWAASREVAQQDSVNSQAQARSREEGGKGPVGSNSRLEPTTGSAGRTWPRDEGQRRMYDQHDMSAHEVVVRSMLDVLQEFGEADVGDRTDTSDDTQRLVLVLCTACPRIEEEVEHFVLRGNFSTQAARIATQLPEKQATTLLEILDAGLGKAIRRGLSRGVYLIWQDVPPGCSREKRDDDTSTNVGRPEHSLSHCLSAAGGGEILGWGCTIGYSALLPPSMTLRRRVCRLVRDANLLGVVGSALGTAERRSEVPTRVALSLDKHGTIDVVLEITKLSPVETSDAEQQTSNAEVDLYEPCSKDVYEPRSTPWRVMGTLRMEDVWPGCLVGQAWGSTVVLRASDARESMHWRELLRSLSSRDLAASVTLPRRLLEDHEVPRRGENDEEGGNAITDALAVAVVVPISAECAVAWSAAAVHSAAITGTSRIRANFRCGSAHAGATMLPSVASAGEDTAHAATGGGRVGSVAPPWPFLEDSSLKGISESEKIFAMRRAQVRRAMQEACLERRRRRQSRCAPGASMRGTSSFDGATAEKRRVRLGLAGSLSPRDSISLRLNEESASEDNSSVTCGRQSRLETVSGSSHVSCSPRSLRMLDAAAGGVDGDDERVSLTEWSSGPRRALYQAMEEASSRSSLQGPETECSSTPGSKEGSRLSEAVPYRRVRDVASRGSGAKGVSLFPVAGDEEPDLVQNVPMACGLDELPMSLMSDPNLASLSRPSLPLGLLELVTRCAHENDVVAADIVNRRLPTSPPRSEPGGGQRDDQGERGLCARRRFIAAVRAATRKIDEESQSSRTVETLHPPRDGEAQKQGLSDKLDGEGMEDHPKTGHSEGVIATAEQDRQDVDFRSEAGEKREKSDADEDCVSRGVAGLRRQYQEVVHGGKRSPVEFVVRAIPEAIRQMTQLCTSRDDLRTAVSDVEERHVRATALVLAAVANGLTVSPEELSAKHKLNRGGGTAAVGDQAVSGGARGAMAAPAVQKVRDYQLQALLLCQLNVLAMDLPESPGSTVAFSALATSGSGMAEEDGSTSASKKGRGKKGKGKRKRKRGSSGEDSAPVRPIDPLPDTRRGRLENYLQPISTMLDACIVVGVSPPPSHASGSEGGACAGSSGGVVDSMHPRAYDGTLADFMELALVGNFASRMPLTLSALFDDFERPPPDSLSTALAAASPNRARALAGDSGTSSSREAGAQASKKCKLTPEDEMPAREKEHASALPGGRAPLDSSSLRSRVPSSAGILLSDRVSMSHNHYKMSGVLNTFREVTLQAPLSAGASNLSVKGDVSGVSGAQKRGVTGDGGEGGEWRTSGARVKGKNGYRMRPTRDARRAAEAERTASASSNPACPSGAVRQSQRVSRTPSTGVGNVPPRVEGTTRETNTSERKRKRRAKASPIKDGASRHKTQGSSVPSPSKKCGNRAGDVPQTHSPGVLVGETPQKHRQKRTLPDSPDSGGRSRSAKLALQAESAVSLATIDERKPLATQEDLCPGSPTAVIASPNSGRAGRRRVMDSPSVESSATARERDGSSPLSWRATAAASRLFVEESPGEVSVEAGSSRRSGRGRSASCDISEISRNLSTESPYPPQPQRHSAVPGTPAS